MDFAAVLAEVAQFLDERRRSWALVGGVGLAALGFSRTTLDLDFVVEAAAQGELVDFLERHGWETLHRSTGYSNHLHPDPRRGRVDFVYVGPETARRLFPDCREVAGPGGVPARVPRPEHLAAMKVTAMKNDPARRFQELSDIRALLTLAGVDREEVHRAFARAGLEKEWHELVATL
jgi:hypothetical protein